ncbi:electron transport complex subunit RsxC [Halorhodospira halophila]|uniref:electron transport complex subunit RsxC n=1 Tax=Halorhodospira TaxID=85108 RepID=UPI001EE874F7|nr:electron transport complex subunit RsxC [Halorhodospira halophila]MCG5544139.1 electron transport complex subunit RsxC [Halorhodospira sp. 9628]
MLLSKPKIIRGGVRTESRKQSTAEAPLEPLRAGQRLYVSLAQHIGAPALPAVAPGQDVAKGQCIGTPEAGLSAAVHAPTSGRVVAIDRHPAPHPSGLTVPTVIIEPDGEERWAPQLPDPMTAPAGQLDPMAIATRVAEAGIVGMGGAAFPAAVKLGAGQPVATLILNGGECEPYLTCDDRLMRERAAGIIDGAQLMARALGAERTAIGVEDNKPEAIHALRRATDALGGPDVVPVPSLWPQGSEKHLIYTLTGCEVPAGARAADIGVVVHNVGTAYAVHRAARHGRPLISRPVTVGGGAVAEPTNFEVPLGLPLQTLLEAAGGLREDPARVLAGGPMMGQVAPLEAGVAKGTNGVIALTAAEIREAEGRPCIRCGRCVDACPMGLMPFEIANRAAAGDVDGAAASGLMDCLTCGSCAYVCPSARPLVQLFHHARGQRAEQAAAKERSELQRRMAEQRAERQRREQERKKAAAAARRRQRAQQKAAGGDSESPAQEQPQNEEKETQT